MGLRHNYHKGRAAIRNYANFREPSDSLRFKLYWTRSVWSDGRWGAFHLHVQFTFYILIFDVGKLHFATLKNEFRFLRNIFILYIDIIYVR